MLRRKRDLLYVSLISGLIGGFGTWLIGAGNSVHVGASILVFGFLGYLLALGIFERKFWTILGSVVVFFLYGSALWGVLPGNPGISWEGHAFGLVGGVIAARLLAAREIKAMRAASAVKVKQIR
jgi:membrane associated rhomboid family serine protease